MARKRGRTYGARAFTRAEDDLIRSAIKTKTPMAALAKLLGRSRSGVYARRVKVEAQLIMDFDDSRDLGPRPLTRDEISELVSFKIAKGQSWKTLLSETWERGVVLQQFPSLYSLRNSHGPSWLEALDLRKLIADQYANDSAGE
jgi:hypothetical protein